MNIVGLQKTSLIDFPGNICCTIFVGGCNLRCRYCYNKDLVLNFRGLHNYSLEEVLGFLQDRSALLDGVCVSGGEPTLQDDLPDFLGEVKRIGLKNKLDTNGTRPQVLKQLAGKGLLDYVAVDIKAPLEKYHLISAAKLSDEVISNLKETIKFIINSSLEYEFRTTVVPDLLCVEDIISIARQIKGGKKYVLQQFHPFSGVLDPEVLKNEPYLKGEVKRAADCCYDYINSVELRGFKQ